ncbi:uncharacterized protein LOC143912203 isoform X1 [Arctopsyche grandis]|uniref:uncharacterized protein LOC143912203 isoform X1 n=1 Tax=Arctopsyche grandis TaxID=121162 RepID=UPI00406D7391
MQCIPSPHNHFIVQLSYSTHNWSSKHATFIVRSTPTPTPQPYTNRNSKRDDMTKLHRHFSHPSPYIWGWKELKKIEQSKRSGCGADEIYTYTIILDISRTELFGQRRKTRADYGRLFSTTPK